MYFNKKSSTAGAEEQYAPRHIGVLLHEYFQKSNSPLAIANRKRMAEKANAEKANAEKGGRV